ncbi:hypothetical protein IFT84_14110 [Rhizobium sp. CFBP 8762]|uniref:hypothetical protein n=1 Tax=Rhizobium sp. CFBP 8762 TaxID=2775279 RepID=UPI001781C292|nr:hypothetical protein [Rhizobium sp. CFBP 8762]MBD8555641.1 hypothetical protein [Rhizobium sp. CFBP 8762]
MDSLGTSQTIHESERLIVTYRKLDPASKTLVITFSPAIERGETSTKIGFGERFLSNLGYDTICFISNDNHWWQVPSMREAVDLAASLSKQYTNVVTYGVSMGGYGALLYSKQFGAQTVIAAVPQFTIDPDKEPYEQRWAHFARRLTFLSDNLTDGLLDGSNVYLLYDPLFKPDTRHVSLIDKDRRFNRIPASFATHSVTRYLARLKILSPLVQDILKGDADVPGFIRTLRSLRRHDPELLLLASEALVAKGKTKLIHRHANIVDESMFSKAGDLQRVAKVFIRANQPLKAVKFLTALYERTKNEDAKRRALRLISRFIAMNKENLNTHVASLMSAAEKLEDQMLIARISRILKRQSNI